MKKNQIVLAVLLTIMFGFIACSSDDNGKTDNVEQISETQLPEHSKSFVRKVFPNASFRHTAKVTEPNYYGTVYATSLDNKVEIDFDRAGNWTEVEMSDNSAIPMDFLRVEVAHILDYVNKNYVGHTILELDRDLTRGFEVTLSNSLELIFNIKQEFIGVDLDMDKDKMLISTAELPQVANTFLKEHFSAAQAVLVKKELDRSEDQYKVYLSNGVKIEFNKRGEWIQLETKRDVSIPDVLIPINVMSFINAKYGSYKIESIEKELSGYQIELINGGQEIELLFSHEGTFIGID